MAVTTNAMAEASVQPKFSESGLFAVAASQAIASGQASGSQFYLMNVASGVYIVDAYLRLSAALSTAATIFHVGVATNDDSFISSAAATSTFNRATKGVPYLCTADTPIYLSQGGGATTAAGTAYVTVICCADLT